MYSTIIDTATLSALLNNHNSIIVDCRFSLTDTAAGRIAYSQGHIPGAAYVHLDEDLSGPPMTDFGRHPLPTPTALNALFGRIGITAGSQVVAYDAGNGAIAARFWWLMHYMGHETCAVLDGGWKAWTDAQFPVRAGNEQAPVSTFVGRPQGSWLIVAKELSLGDCLIDSRAPERYSGARETLDSAAGHIPGAINYYYADNLGDDGRFRSPEALREQMLRLTTRRASEDLIFYCGSGVTACHNLLAQAYAGLPIGKLYAGSWSDWITDPRRPVATGAD